MSRHCTVCFLALLLGSGSCKQSVQPVSLKGALDSSLDTASDSSGGGDQQVGPSRWRVAFLVDVSQSMLASDPDGARQKAAAEVVSWLSGEDAAFGFLLLSPCLEINGGRSSGFVQNSEIISQALPGLATSSGLSDLQSGLEAAKRMVEDDINASTAEQLAGTVYELILVVDGAPSIYCNDGCDPVSCDGGVCLPCDAGLCPADAGSPQQNEICDQPRTHWSGPHSASCDDGSNPYSSLRQCEPFNVRAGLEPLGKEIHALQERGPHRVRLSVILLETTELPLLERDRAMTLFLPTAKAGGGYYRVIKASQLSILFLDLLGLQDPRDL